ncbi:MAG TPA: hypothetical protein DEF47_18370 [Herpetosiphon sp.]|uniref:Uncharacterized protein n=2 Tax=Herpetosiphon TaxID=64 RepID=A9B565_HERA2|nr:conserved hypothetical protein [Herpetosiphon aurantiacus DSM 785]HBW51858.1 hypothetical protein [Herpetosiphon sp.]
MSEAMSESVSIQEEYLWNSAREDLPPKKPLVEIGWVLIGTFEKIDEGAIRTARERTREYLRQHFPEFSWRVPIVVRPDPDPGDVLAEPIRLIDMAVTERLTKGWDFAIAFTATDLHSLSKQYTLGTPASGLDAAAISTARLDPTAQRSMVRKAERELVLSNRIWALFLHLLGDLLALPHNDDHSSPMSVPRVPEDLDAVHDFSSEEHEWMLESLTEVADLRVEETGQSSRNPFFFTLRVLVRSGREIIAAVARNRPWILVWHLTKFTGAALSTLLILLFTAEVWDVGVRLPLAEVAGALGITIAGTTTFVVTRQRLLTRRTRFRLTEQVVVTDFAIILTILGSMLSMVLLLISAAMLVIWVVPNELAERWTDFAILSLEHNLALAGTVTIIGLIVGALGASIEDQTTFRHVAFIDEET